MSDEFRDQENRPDPDALLALASRSRKGRLTIFLGAAPGVGKTFAMLSRARIRQMAGTDIVVGLVETHGRAETEALVEGLEILPRKTLEYKGRSLEEFDLDAALARKPAILIVDELAHSNLGESRHPKRYQDVEELLASGIDVWTALNIQHLESLSDIVSQITGVQVREIVPDRVLKQADDVILIDLPPEELLARLREGKVYVPANAARATESFFRLGNLTALRELALRRTADRVDDEMVDFLKQNAIEGPWRTSERLLVCVGPDELSEKVVMTASHLSSGLNAPWLVVCLERADQVDEDPQRQARVDDTLRLAERLGGETRRLYGRDFVEELLKVARKEHITQIVIGAPRRSSLQRLFRRSLADELLNRLGGLGLHFVTEDKPSGRRSFDLFKRFGSRRVGLTPRQYATALLVTVAATAAGRAIIEVVALPNVSMLFLLAVLVAALREGYLTALLASVLSALAYNFFFIPPIGTLTIAAPHEVFAFIIFIVATLLAGGIASRLHKQALLSARRAAQTQTLYEVSSKLAGTLDREAIVWTAVSQLNSTIQRPVALLAPVDGQLELQSSWPPDTELGVAELTAARFAYEKGEVAGSGTGTLPNAKLQFRPLRGPSGTLAVCGYAPDAEGLDPTEEHALAAILDQVTIALDRSALTVKSVEQSARLENERFRSALLSSISHDLRTPLATITGAVTSLKEFGDRMPEESRRDLLISIEEEGERLSRFVGNLLDMTRIESGAVEPKRDWVDVGEVVLSSVERAKRLAPGIDISASVAQDLPLIRADSVLLGQVLFNLIDNACKHGGGEPVTVYAKIEGQAVAVSVTDLGKGIPEKDLDRVFEKFYRRSKKTDGRKPGTGLGLSIAKGFVEAMGGSIQVESPAVRRRGTRFTVRFAVEASANDMPVAKGRQVV
ncbi:sensor histidine kinase [Rhizobium oryzicola]|uniref:histidine kinase n=1 Tax=Rhizobium oryzicola TaxID=1232668 RepID=A0ABT8T454_9HYPH|nr:sensor histidine kinase KdpD [Rhizobium oryzicola]MDO1584933.1 sensor histidine kinase KdpD [Rhizobium oryzicola]